MAAPGQKHICPTFMWTLQSHSGAVSAVERTGFVGFNTFTGLSLLSRHTVTASYRHVLLMKTTESQYMELSLLLKYIPPHHFINTQRKKPRTFRVKFSTVFFFCRTLLVLSGVCYWYLVAFFREVRLICDKESLFLSIGWIWSRHLWILSFTKHPTMKDQLDFK